MIVANKNKIKDMAKSLSENGAGRSLWKDARLRFIQNKAATLSLFILILIVSFSFVGPYFAVWSYEQIDWNAMGSAARVGMPSIESGHYFGTDDLGRDLYSRVIQGTQISLMVGVLGASVAVIVGTLYGATSGYLGGKTDQIMMRIVDILMSIPYMFVLILLLVVFGRSIGMLFIGIGLLSWLDMSRIVRGQTLNLKNKEFIEAFNSELRPAMDEFKPEFVLVSAGFDAHKGDPLGQLNYTADGYGVVAEILYDISQKYANERIFYMLEGGYNADNVSQSVQKILVELISEN